MLRQYSLACEAAHQHLQRCCAQQAARAERDVVKFPAKFRNELKYRCKKADQNDVSTSDPRPVYASIILERYPICLPKVPAWASEHAAWREAWNAWKYKVAKPGWLDCERRTDGRDDIVRIPTAL